MMGYANSEMTNNLLEQRYIVAGSKTWTRRIFDDVISKYPGRWYLIDSQEQLNVEAIQTVSPQYIFFLHWSWKVPKELVDNCECICFHMTDVPYGRGGSPLQNLSFGDILIPNLRHSG
jgi:methionyl-tRNA formyltransferase